MAIPFCILGVYNMANGLEQIADILKRLNDELKLDNDKWERANESTTTLRPGDDGAAPTGSIEHTKTSNRRETDEL
jgi:uncharacterized phage infection (PIP) family protein YhgE